MSKIVPVTLDLMALPECISASNASVLLANGLTICTGSRPLSPDEVDQVLKEMGRNAAQACLFAQLVE